MNELFQKVIAWASARNIIGGAQPINQFAKLSSEFGEIVEAFEDTHREEVKDGIGDSLVVLIIIYAMLGMDIAASYRVVVNRRVRDVGTASHTRVGTMWSLLDCAALLGHIGDNILKGRSDIVAEKSETFISNLAAIAQHHNFTLEQCLEAAYGEIKDRKGVMYNGAFVKSTDASYPGILEALGRHEEAQAARLGVSV